MVLLLATVGAAETHVGDWDVTGEITASGNFATFGDSSYVTPFSGWSGSSRMVAVRQPNSVSSGVSAGFMFSNNQTGNAQNIAQLMFLNEAIGAAEKRVAQILVTTGGTTNSGKMYFRVFDAGSATNALIINRFGTVTVGDGLTFPDGYTQETAFMGATSGGSGNTAAGSNATVGGGYNGTASGDYATVGGGGTNEASGYGATVAGGGTNDASGYCATVGGGAINSADYSYTTVGGGYYNEVTANYGTIAGGGPSNPGSPSTTNNVVTDQYGTIGGGGENQAGDNFGTASDAAYATVGGGESNTASDANATVGGGGSNTADGSHATVGGGYSNDVTDDYGTVGGGWGNQAGDNAGTTGDAVYATVGGGWINTAGASRATVGGGDNNDASGDQSTIGGGYLNTATSLNAAVGGGWSNDATGEGATIPGGLSNTASGYASLAAGYNANASHDNSFVWSDNSGAGTSANTNTFNIWASNGVYLNGVLHAASDRNKKDNFEPVDSRAVLAKVAALPMSTWNYKTEDGGYRHMGPMGQDFHAAFGLGSDDKHITTVDADGVALAAIQGLYQRMNEVVQEKDAQIAALQKEVEALKGTMATLMEK
jgi:hypothetical protein